MQFQSSSFALMKSVALSAAAIIATCSIPVVAYGQSRASLRACVERASIDSALYPQGIDRGTVITGASCRESGGRVVYVYDNRLDALKSRLSSNAMETRAIAIRSTLCTNPSLTALLKLVDMKYVYYDAANVYVGTITNRIEDCR